MSQLPAKLFHFLRVVENLTPPCFQKVLRTEARSFVSKDSNPAYLTVQVKEKGRYLFTYKVPESACVKPASYDASASTEDSGYNDVGVLPLSGLLAVFDELTTLAIVNEDDSARAGVSTTLSAELAPYGLNNLPRAGENIDIDIRVMKLGKNFGFLEAEAKIPESGKIIAIGKHTKYLGGVSYLQSMALGWFLPVTSFASEYFVSSVSSLPRNVEEIKSVEDLVEFDMNEASNEGSMSVGLQHCNPLKSCHGGFQAMAMEQMAQNHLANMLKGSESYQLQSIAIDYISRGKGKITFCTKVTPINDLLTLVNVRAKGKGRAPISDGVLHFIQKKQNSRL
jgi:acyl-coenzyme A thioesterase PaaI-like protein